MNIVANELKTRGVGVFDDVLQHNDEAIITVRGKSKYVTVSLERYNYLRKCELETALLEAKAEIKAGRGRVMSADEHLAQL
ncbi:MAG: prevent-host-death protein [Proteobacteria bacterium]|nr:prevent-host-death protein [Pseudomonadota bacterium]MCH9711681.1 prevent-host-death protein [Pseudomonadota bacterium]MCH9749807.1 prevent-host-death protein [Pseudomonadota bacterium]